MIKHVIRCAAASWVMAASLGLIFAGAVMHTASIRDLWIACAIQVSLILSTAAAVLIAPLTAWALRGAMPVTSLVALWFVLVVYVLLVAPHSGPLALIGSLAMSVIGLISIGLLKRS